MESIDKVIFAFNSLIDVNERRFKHYSALADKAGDSDLKRVFKEHASQSQYFTTGLHKWRSAYGVMTYPEKKFSVFSMTWNQIKEVFFISDRATILSQCEAMEYDALKVYKTAVQLSFLPDAALSDVQEQIADFQRALDDVHALQRSYSSYAMTA